MEHPADLVLVVGDVNSTLTCCIVAKKLNVKVAHAEAVMMLKKNDGFPVELHLVGSHYPRSLNQLKKTLSQIKKLSRLYNTSWDGGF